MKFSHTITAALIGVALATTSPTLTVAQTVISQALNPEQISLRAKQITVRIDGSGIGSGVIVGQSGETYNVLTNWHVVKNSGQYTVETIDGRVHQVDTQSVKQLSGLDLAVLTFNTNQNYQTAEIGNSALLNEGQSIYFAGYPGELKQESDRYYRFFTTNLVGILPKPTENGYALIYNGEAFPGMSGGPVLDKNGMLIGIHGEANIHARTFGTSNYAIPIDTYQTAIAPNSTPQPETTATTPQQPETTVTTPQQPETNVTVADTPSNEQTPQEIVIDIIPDDNSNSSSNNSQSLSDQPQSPSITPPVNSQPPKPQQNSTTISSIPTFSSPTSSGNQFSPEVTQPTQPTQPAQTNQATQPTQANQEFNSLGTIGTTLISARTGIDYAPLSDLLEQGKWEEADRQTYELIEQIVKTAKNRNPHMFIELKTIAEFSCTDIQTIDQLWRKYSGGKFGFTPQQEIWNSVNDQGDFSTETWRRFATSVGWKKGDVASSSGYLLYEQLDFDPTQAPKGHLPWWFALSEEEQNVIKHLFARCNLNSVAENKPGNNPEKPQTETPAKPTNNQPF
ncbi:GUN4 domain protein [Stanieria cyanosphaera PCC 7437]|uniref:GUN4 domain protein n=1 Tax=Stanieria cyanosphaera (strain ATCC 29371 / PCC 7437) TaxID=111780 RepID=K9XZ30_STAC7|nr:GUN4 domain-containing protein [Stanieria cyanosphaera]AFZ37773.1 GUN4 domain protein [Stanieria cyanosphaera PCC 7437]